MQRIDMVNGHPKENFLPGLLPAILKINWMKKDTGMIIFADMQILMNVSIQKENLDALILMEKNEKVSTRLWMN